MQEKTNQLTTRSTYHRFRPGSAVQTTAYYDRKPGRSSVQLKACTCHPTCRSYFTTSSMCTDTNETPETQRNCAKQKAASDYNGNGARLTAWPGNADDRWRDAAERTHSTPASPRRHRPGSYTPGKGQPAAIAVIRLVSFTTARLTRGGREMRDAARVVVTVWLSTAAAAAAAVARRECTTFVPRTSAPRTEP